MALPHGDQHSVTCKKDSRVEYLISASYLCLYHELLITSRMLKSNAGASLAVWMVGVFARLIANPQPINTTLAIVIESLFDAFIFAYVFDILNQITSVEEDALNKPHRPIPAGLLTMHGAGMRLVLSWLLSFPLIAAVTGREASHLLFLWQLWTLFCYVWPGFNHPFFRNAFAGVGTYMMYRWVDLIICNHIPNTSIWPGFDALFAVWVSLTCQLQEFHDVDGDRKAGRRTLPVILSPDASLRLRRYTAIFMLYSAIVCFRWVDLGQYSGTTYAKLFVFAFLFLYICIVIAIRVWVPRSKEYDEHTYKVYYILASCLFSLYLRVVGSS
ncbi:UbiA prenyltransferase family-domain-containing protein [Aspergillus floccosus]